jgi:hypothetical protein
MLVFVQVFGVGADDLGEVGACVLPDVGDELLRVGSSHEEVGLNGGVDTSSPSLLEAQSSLRVFLESCLPLCSARARVAKHFLMEVNNMMNNKSKNLTQYHLVFLTLLVLNSILRRFMLGFLSSLFLAEKMLLSPSRRVTVCR